MSVSQAGQRPPLHAQTATDHGAVVIILAYLWIFVAIIAALVRFVGAWSQAVRFKLDDAFFAFGTALAIGSSVCFHLAANAGLGRHMAALTDAQLDQYYKTIFAGTLAGIATQAFAKFSVIMLSDRVAPRGSCQFYSVLGVVAAWTLFSCFAIAFQCPLPRPWVFHPSQCPSRGDLQIVLILWNILTDGFLALWIVPTVWTLLMDVTSRMTVIALFAARLIVCAVALVELVSVFHHVHEEDQTWSILHRIICQICVIYLSILLSTLPRTNRFIMAMQSSHNTAYITDLELAHPDGSQGTVPKRSVRSLHTFSLFGKSNRTIITKRSIHSLSTGKSGTNPREAHVRPRSHSYRSQEPLVEVPLELIPSDEQTLGARSLSTSGTEAAENATESRNVVLERSHQCPGKNHGDRTTRRHITSKDFDTEDLPATCTIRPG